MKKFLFLGTILVALAIGLTSYADLRKSPFQPHDDKRFNESEGLASGEIFVGSSSGARAEVALSGDATLSSAGALSLASGSVDSPELVAGSVDEDKLAVPTADGLNAMRVARFNLDCTASSCVIGTVATSITLPAKSVIYQTYWFTEEQFVDAGSGTVALHCEDANNLFTAADITGNAVGSIIAGNATGVIATMTVGIAAACVVTATIAASEQTAGIMNGYILYSVHD